MPNEPVNTATLGGKPVYDAPANVTCNYFEMHSGGSRYGTGEFLLTRGDYAALVGVDGAGTGAVSTMLVLKASDGSTGVELDVVVGGWLPLSTDVTGDNPNDVVRVVVHDKRVRHAEKVEKFYNVQREGFPTQSPADELDFYPSTLNSGSFWDWAGLIGNLELPGNPTLASAPTTWKPRNLILDGVPMGRALDDVAARLFVVVGYKWADDAYTLDVPGAQAADNNTVATAAADYAIGSTADARRNPKRLPGKIMVRFPVHADGADDPYTSNNRYYEKETTNATGDPATHSKGVLHVGEYVALRDTGSGGGIVNQTELDAVAADVAVRWVNFTKQVPGGQTYAGIWPFHPDGKIRGVRWVSTRHGATTELRYNNDRDWNAITDFARTVDNLSNQLIVGYGGSFVGLGLGGTRYVRGGSSQLFLVQLVADEDTDLYDVYPFTDTMHVATPIATAVEPEYRPLGSAAGFAEYATTGIGYYDSDGAFVLVLPIEEKYQTCLPGGGEE